MAATIAIRIAVREAAIRGLPHAFDHATSVALAAIGGGFVGSRLFHVLDHAADYAADPFDALAFWTGGASIVGGILGGIAVGLTMLWRRKLPIGAGIDAAALGLPVGMAIGRIGDIINGEHWSIPCFGLAWCVRYTDPESAGQRELVHPAVAYEMILDLGIAAVLFWIYARSGRRIGSGRLMFVFLTLYGMVRFFVTFYRVDAPVHLGLALAQWTALAFLVAGAAALLWRRPYSA